MAKKVKAGLKATSRGVAYIQAIKRGGKLGKPEPVVITTVRAAPPKRRKRR